MLRFTLLASGLSLFLTGCSEPSGSLTGSVTVDGQPLKKGLMNFDPSDGNAPTAGCPVENGHYTISTIKPGKYRVRVSGEPEGTAGRSQEDVMKMPQKELDALTKNPLPPGVTGNDEEIEIKAGNKTHDIKLTSKSK